MPYRCTLSQKVLSDVPFGIFFGPKGTSLRAKTARGYDDKGPKRPECEPAGVAHFSGQLTNPCIYDQSTTSATTITSTKTVTGTSTGSKGFDLPRQVAT